MTQNLQDLIAAKLGMVEPAKPLPTNGTTIWLSTTNNTQKGWVEPKPEAKYEYYVHYTRTEYGTATVIATDQEEASDTCDGDIEWYDTSDVEQGHVELLSSTAVNQEAIDDWVHKYGNKYGEDGSPMCSECLDEYNNSDEMTPDPDDEDAWYCASCTADKLANDDDYYEDDEPCDCDSCKQL